VAPEDVEGVPELPPSILYLHCYVAFLQFKLKKGDKVEEALRRVARMSSSRDLVEDIVAYGVCGRWLTTGIWAMSSRTNALFK
jgi:hypothetical protein